MTPSKRSAAALKKQQLKASAGTVPNAAPPAAATATPKTAGQIAEAPFKDGQAEGQLFVKLPGTPPIKHENEPPASKNRKGIRIIASHGESHEELQVRALFSSVYLNSNTARTFAQSGIYQEPEKNLDMTACAAEMVSKVEALDKGDISEIKHQLLSQAVALQAIFGEMARRAALNMGTHLAPTETYMRLALKAQAQCRATLETLAEIVNPRPIYLNPKQVNVATGSQQVNNAEGPQQVNNGTAPSAIASEGRPAALTAQPEPPTLPAARVEENKIPENELLEAKL